MKLEQVALREAAFSYPSQPLFQNVSIALDCRPSVRIGLHGANGAGKTTLIKLMAGLLSLQKGTITWLTSGQETLERSQAMQQMGIAMGDAFFMRHQSLGDNLSLYGSLYGVAQHAIDPWLKRLLLWPHRHTLFGQLSTGQRKKASLLRALLHQPPLLLLDEPLSGLDAQSQEIITDCLKEYPGSWLVASHHQTWLETHCSHQWHLHGGGIHVA
jgi:ABC-type multidrug transport system ATPase subunit